MQERGNDSINIPIFLRWCSGGGRKYTCLIMLKSHQAPLKSTDMVKGEDGSGRSLGALGPTWILFYFIFCRVLSSQERSTESLNGNQS